MTGALIQKLGFGMYPILFICCLLLFGASKIVLETEHLLLYTFSSELSYPTSELAHENELWRLNVCWL